MVYIPHVHYTHCNMYCIHTVNKICMNLASEIQCHDNFIHALHCKIKANKDGKQVKTVRDTESNPWELHKACICHQSL